MLKMRLRQLPEKRDAIGFDMGVFLRGIVDMLISIAD